MGFLFRPDSMLGSVTEFDASTAAKNGVLMVFSDLDNTLARWNDGIIPSSSRAFAARLQSCGIDLCIVSNNSPARVAPIAQALNASYIARAKKPLPLALTQTQRKRGLGKDQCVLIGDQLITDVLAGNLAGIRTLLVKPIDLSAEYRGTRINRRLEGILLRMLNLRWEEKP